MISISQLDTFPIGFKQENPGIDNKRNFDCILILRKYERYLLQSVGVFVNSRPHVFIVCDLRSIRIKMLFYFLNELLIIFPSVF